MIECTWTIVAPLDHVTVIGNIPSWAWRIFEDFIENINKKEGEREREGKSGILVISIKVSNYVTNKIWSYIYDSSSFKQLSNFLCGKWRKLRIFIVSAVIIAIIFHFLIHCFDIVFSVHNVSCHNMIILLKWKSWSLLILCSRKSK